MSVRRREDVLGAIHVREQASQRIFDNVSHADRGGEVVDHRTVSDQTVNERFVKNAASHQAEFRVTPRISKVALGAGAEIVENGHAVAVVKKPVTRCEPMKRRRPDQDSCDKKVLDARRGTRQIRDRDRESLHRHRNGRRLPAATRDGRPGSGKSSRRGRADAVTLEDGLESAIVPRTGTPATRR